MFKSNADTLNFKVSGRECLAARLIFFVSGFGFSTWAPMIPMVKERLQIGSDVLGMLLLCIGVSSFLVMPVAGLLVQKFGCKKILCLMGFLMGVELIALSSLPNIYMYALFLLILGSIGGILDVSMNIHAVVVEKLSKKRMMSSMHALWSVGCFAGAGLFTILYSIGFSIISVTIIHCIIIFLIVVLSSKYFLPYKGANNEKAIAFPKGIVIVFGILAFVSFLGEGSMMDWSGVFLTEAKSVDLSLAGVGYAVFSAAMLISRLFGDKIVQYFGEKRIVIYGAVLAASGYLISVVMDNFFIVQFGFFLLGLGAANIVPVVFSLLGHQNVMSISSAVTAVTSMGYMGVMFGPALLGFIAHAVGITAVFCILSGLFFIQAIVFYYVAKSLIKE